jgi:hypothetical protein
MDYPDHHRSPGTDAIDQRTAEGTDQAIGELLDRSRDANRRVVPAELAL